jgi:hypothetical protein
MKVTDKSRRDRKYLTVIYNPCPTLTSQMSRRKPREWQPSSRSPDTTRGCQFRSLSAHLLTSLYEKYKYSPNYKVDMFKAWTLKKSPGNPKVVKFPQQWACSPLLLFLFCRFLFVCFCLMARGILLSDQGLNSGLSGQSPNHWTARECPPFVFLIALDCQHSTR